MNTNHLICVIDDNPDYLLIFQHLFASSLPEYTIRCFEDGEIFLSELSQMIPMPSLILLDWHMPIVDGHQVLIRLKQQENTRLIPTIMMSALATSQEVEACYKLGANSFIRKETDYDQIEKTLTKLCRLWIESNR